MQIEIDINRLRESLIDYFGTAMVCCYPIAIADLSKVENAPPEELIRIAEDNGIDILKFRTDA